MSGWTLIGAEASYYTGKARAYLRWKGVPFEEMLATRDVYREIIIPRTGVRYIPVLLTPDGAAVQDTTEIIDWVEAKVPGPSVYPEGPLQRMVALLLEIYGDEWLVLPAMHYRWSFAENREFVLREFGETVVPAGTREEQIAAGEQLSAPFSGSLPLLGVTPETIPAIEAWTLALLDQLNAHFSAHPFLLGTQPSIGDFGLMGPLYAHLGRDPYPARLLRGRAPRLVAWIERMNAPEPVGGAFLPDDAIPGTLLPILTRMFSEHLPVLRDSAEQLAVWLDANPGATIPRGIGAHRFRIGEIEGQRVVFPYTVWMFQRAVDHLAGLAGEARRRVEAFLEAHGGLEALRAPIRRRVRRERNRLVPA